MEKCVTEKVDWTKISICDFHAKYATLCNNAVTSDFTTSELTANLHKIEAKRMVSGIMICSSKIAVI